MIVSKCTVQKNKVILRTFPRSCREGPNTSSIRDDRSLIRAGNNNVSLCLYRQAANSQQEMGTVNPPRRY